MQLLSSPFLKPAFYSNTQAISVKTRRMKNYALLSQPFNEAGYWAHKNIKGFFKRNRLYGFHLSFIHFSLPVSWHLLEVHHTGNRACIEFSSISQQDIFSAKLLGCGHWKCGSGAHKSLATHLLIWRVLSNAEMAAQCSPLLTPFGCFHFFYRLYHIDMLNTEQCVQQSHHSNVQKSSCGSQWTVLGVVSTKPKDGFGPRKFPCILYVLNSFFP